MKYYWVYAIDDNDTNIDLIKYASKDAAGETYTVLIKHSKSGTRAGMIRKKMTAEEVADYIREHFPDYNLVVKG